MAESISSVAAVAFMSAMATAQDEWSSAEAPIMNAVHPVGQVIHRRRENDIHRARGPLMKID